MDKQLCIAIANDMKCRVDEYIDEAVQNCTGRELVVVVRDTLAATRAALRAVEQNIQETMGPMLFTEADEEAIAEECKVLTARFRANFADALEQQQGATVYPLQAARQSRDNEN